jgi:hypothetical protein
MAIELPPRTMDVLDERLASLEDPAFAAHLADENPSLYLRALAQKDREARRRTLWGVSVAGTAIVSIAVGVFASPAVMKFFTPVHLNRQPAVTAPPRPLALPPVAPRAHVQPQHHRAAPAAPKPIVVDQALRAHAAAQAELRRIEARVAAEEAAARHAQAQAQAAEASAAAAHRAAYRAVERPAAIRPQVRHEPRPAAVAPAPATEQAASTTPSASTASANAPVTMPGPDAPPPSNGTKAGPPSGVWTEHYPSGGGGVMVGRDPCTPPGGRIGSVLIQSVMGAAMGAATGGRLHF